MVSEARCNGSASLQSRLTSSVTFNREYESGDRTPEIHESVCSRRLDASAQDPCVFANLTTSTEPMLFEEFSGGTKEESTLRLAAVGRFGDRLDQSAARPGDKVQCAFQRRASDALVSMFLVHEDARDAPHRQGRCVLVIFTLVLEVGQLLGAAVLAPPLCFSIVVENQCSVSPSGLHPVFFDVAIVQIPLATLGVVANAPAASVDPIISFNEFSECTPRGGAKRTDRVRHRNTLSSSHSPDVRANCSVSCIRARRHRRVTMRWRPTIGLSRF